MGDGTSSLCGLFRTVSRRLVECEIKLKPHTKDDGETLTSVRNHCSDLICPEAAPDVRLVYLSSTRGGGFKAVFIPSTTSDERIRAFKILEKMLYFVSAGARRLAKVSPCVKKC
jgi:hypothetical protein